MQCASFSESSPYGLNDRQWSAVVRLQYTPVAKSTRSIGRTKSYNFQKILDYYVTF